MHTVPVALSNRRQIDDGGGPGPDLHHATPRSRCLRVAASGGRSAEGQVPGPLRARIARLIVLMFGAARYLSFWPRGVERSLFGAKYG